VTRAKVLKLGSVEVEAPVMELSLQAKGAFTDPYVAGNVGAGVLKRFNIVFDYGHGQLIFERNANDATLDTFDRVGIWINQAEGGFDIMDVFAGSPASEAGIKVGDRIVAIDSQPATTLSLPAVRQRFRTEAPGTQVRLRLRSGDAEREVTVTLRDLV